MPGYYGSHSQEAISQLDGRNSLIFLMGIITKNRALFFLMDLSTGKNGMNEQNVPEKSISNQELR
jgi:hypothetical protein